MPVIIALVASGILLLFCALQVALLTGAPIGRFAWGGDETLPEENRTKAIVAAVLSLFGILVLLQAVSIAEVLPAIVDQVAIWLLAAVSFAGFVVSAASPAPAVRAIMTPTSLIMAALTLFVAVTGHLVK
jgi:hypothetical protein